MGKAQRARDLLKKAASLYAPWTDVPATGASDCCIKSWRYLQVETSQDLLLNRSPAAYVQHGVYMESIMFRAGASCACAACAGLHFEAAWCFAHAVPDCCYFAAPRLGAEELFCFSILRTGRAKHVPFCGTFSRFHFLRTSYCSFVTPTNFICTTCSQCGCAAPSASMPPVTSACDVVCSSESMVFPERNSVFVWSESSSRQCFQYSVLSTTCSSECFLVAFSMYNPLQEISKKLQPFETTGSSKPLEAVAPDASQAQ